MREFDVKTLSLVAYVVDIIILVIGVMITAGAAILFFYVHQMTKVTNDEVYPIVVVIICIGVILTLTSILGICGVCRKTSALLSGFIAAMVLILLAQFAAVVICFTFEASTKYFLHAGLVNSLRLYNKQGVLKPYTDSMDYVQENMKCCGINGPSDYNDYHNATFWNNEGKTAAHYYITTGMSHTLAFYGKTGDLIKFTDSVDFMQNNLKCCGLNGPSDYSDYYNATFWVNSGNETNVPDSCCLKAVQKADCGKDMSLKPDEKVIYIKGCYKETLSFIETYLTVFGSAALVFMLIQLANIFVNIMLQRRFKEHEDYQLTSTKMKQVKQIDADAAADRSAQKKAQLEV